MNSLLAFLKIVFEFILNTLLQAIIAFFWGNLYMKLGKSTRKDRCYSVRSCAKIAKLVRKCVPCSMRYLQKVARAVRYTASCLIRLWKLGMRSVIAKF